MKSYIEDIEKNIKNIETNIKWIDANINNIKRSRSDVKKEDFDCYDDRNYDHLICKQYNEAIENIQKGIEEIERIQIAAPLVLEEAYKNKVNEFREFLSYHICQ